MAALATSKKLSNVFNVYLFKLKLSHYEHPTGASKLKFHFSRAFPNKHCKFLHLFPLSIVKIIDHSIAMLKNFALNKENILHKFILMLIKKSSTRNYF